MGNNPGGLVLKLMAKYIGRIIYKQAGKIWIIVFRALVRFAI
jgi:hypothetical protein